MKYTPKTFLLSPVSGNTKYIVSVGASIGRSWHISEIHQRVNNDDINQYSFGYRCVYAFDKSSAITALVKFPIIPYAVIIKECAAYFPRDILLSKELVVNWVKLIQTNNGTFTQSVGDRPVAAGAPAGSRAATGCITKKQKTRLHEATHRRGAPRIRG